MRFFFIAMIMLSAWAPLPGYSNSVQFTSPVKWWQNQSSGYYYVNATITCSGFTMTQAQHDQLYGYGNLGCGAQTTMENGQKIISSVTGTSCQVTHGNDEIIVGKAYPTFTCNIEQLHITPSGSKTELDPDWYAHTKICALWVRTNGDGTSTPLTGSSTSSGCVNPPPPDDAVVCTANSMTIDHGQVGPSSFNGSSKSGTGSVKCTGGDATVKVYLSSGTINFSNGGKSTLTFSGGGTSTMLSVKENTTSTFTVTSTLSASGTIKIGDFSGSTSLITDIQ